uniref:Uncharacterized protein n=1 Tax=Setaria italica TaxID=4555 RepID=A0A0Q3SFG2_SETIT
MWLLVVAVYPGSKTNLLSAQPLRVRKNAEAGSDGRGSELQIRAPAGCRELRIGARCQLLLDSIGGLSQGWRSAGPDQGAHQGSKISSWI